MKLEQLLKTDKKITELWLDDELTTEEYEKIIDIIKTKVIFTILTEKEFQDGKRICKMQKVDKRFK